MTAYYNDADPFAADWLAELMADNLIAPGVIDRRSIIDVQPADLRGFTQVHLFAGIGTWSAAARLVGWPDDRSLWSASCPCPPFSTAGKVKACPGCGGLKPVPHVRRTGAFLCSLCGHAWLADQRHLWPEVWRLVRDGRPPCLVGEQVASEDGRTWLDLVRASLEILAYDAWGVDTCAAGFGAPHIRQRLYWVADTTEPGRGGRSARNAFEDRGGSPQSGRLRSAGGLVDSERARLEGLGGHVVDGHEPGRLGALAPRSASEAGDARGMAEPRRIGWDRGQGASQGGVDDGSPAGWLESDHGPIGGDQAGAGGLADAGRGGLQRGEQHGDDASAPGEASREARQLEWRRIGHRDGGIDGRREPGPVNGLWRDADWLACTDGRWRAVESSTFPLADAGAFRHRVAELRGAGNAVNLSQAAGFLAAIMNEVAR